MYPEDSCAAAPALASLARVSGGATAPAHSPKYYSSDSDSDDDFIRYIRR
jgi:hypothetical protein